MYNYFLKTQRVGFSIWSKPMLPLALRLWSNPEVSKYICANGVFTSKEIKARLLTEINTQENFNFSYWPIFLLKTGDFLGCCGLRPYGRSVEIGIHILPGYWGKGIAKETLNTLISYAHTTLSYPTIYAGHAPANIASSHLLNSLGFKFLKEEYYPPTGLNHPLYTHKNSPM